ncbi:MAG: cytochrome c-type biogenesis protein [Pseudomonadota bacterium]
MKVIRAAIAAVLILSALPAAAIEPSERLPDPALEARARALSSELRCLVCQNQSIDDSDALLAKDLRVKVRERISAGDTDAEVKTFLVQRYGEFVLLRPQFNARTYLLWLAPVLLLAGVGWLVLRSARSRPAAVAASQGDLSEAERKRLAELTDNQRG